MKVRVSLIALLSPPWDYKLSASRLGQISGGVRVGSSLHLSQTCHPASDDQTQAAHSTAVEQRSNDQTPELEGYRLGAVAQPSVRLRGTIKHDVPVVEGRYQVLPKPEALTRPRITLEQERVSGHFSLLSSERARRVGELLLECTLVQALVGRERYVTP